MRGVHYRAGDTIYLTLRDGHAMCGKCCRETPACGLQLTSRQSTPRTVELMTATILYGSGA